jgi:hypothetical protein
MSVGGGSLTIRWEFSKADIALRGGVSNKFQL